MLNIDKTVLIITACIKPNLDTFKLSLTDSNKRLKQYIECIEWSLDNTLFKNIVFVDNSGYPADPALIKYASDKGKNFEWLSFTGNKKQILTYGKGYGEGEIVEYAFNNSKLLKKSTYFCKLTGRLIIDNINIFIKLADINKIYFWSTGLNLKNKHSDGIETRFYSMPISIYKDTFIDAYSDVNDRTGMWLEKVFYRRFCNSYLENRQLFWYPDFHGQSGSMGINYNLSKKRLFAKILASGIGLYSPKK